MSKCIKVRVKLKFQKHQHYKLTYIFDYFDCLNQNVTVLDNITIATICEAVTTKEGKYV